ncbi:reverse transcriptase (RNA-dependent DNA polymerase) domain-containing protein [Phthorimaea operculella]|nr:reverse transcriptase (RNA-dependent DNA polymerase) domain-containing protein [Phthorimaea operculella]
MFLNNFELLLCKLVDENKRFLICGDINVDYTTIDPLQPWLRRELDDLLNSFSMTNIVDFPTRVDKLRSTSIDCGIVSTINQGEGDVTARPVHTAISDHHGQDRIFHRKKVSIKKKKSTPWVSEELSSYINNFESFCEIRRQYPCNDTIQNCVNYYYDMIKTTSLRDRKAFNEKRIKSAKNPSKEVWNIINEETNFKNMKSRDMSLKLNGTHVPVEGVADCFNKHFLTITSQLPVCSNKDQAMKHLKNILDEQCVPELSFPKVTDNMLNKVLKTMIKTSNTLDLYDISVNILLSVWPVLCNILVHLINEIISHGIYPNALKCTRVCPVYKGKGETDKVDNHRPITIVPTISKIIESILSSSMMEHLEKNDLLTKVQYAYRQNKSTTSAAQQVVDCVLTGLDSRYKTAGIFCDLSKAFDVIGNELLLQKLERYGIKQTAHKLLKSFLTNRKQTVQVTIGGRKLRSEAGEVTIGIPQGSALGNTMFLVFINDLASHISEAPVTLFADDTSVQWFSDNGLVLNLTKSNVMLFSGRSIPVPVDVVPPMPTCTQCKFLGLTLDQHLNWKAHIQLLCDRLGSATYALRKIKPVVSASILRQTYFAYFNSIMSYATILWADSSESDRVFVLQKRALRIIEGLKARDTCRGVFKKHNILTLYSLYLYGMLVYVRRNLPSFSLRLCGGRALRNAGRLATVPRKTALATKNPRVIGPTFYEHLPTDLKQEPNDETFCRRVKNLLLDCELYSVDEFMNRKFL